VALAGQVPDVGSEPGPYMVVGGYSGDGWPGEALDPDEPEVPPPEEPLDGPPVGLSGMGVVGQTTISLVVVTTWLEVWYSTVR